MMSRAVLGSLLIVLMSVVGCATPHDLMHRHAVKRRAIQAFKSCNSIACQSKHYRDGWIEGYYDVAEGSGGKHRPFAPEKYYTPPFETPAGQQQLEEWKCGYADGVNVAMECGADRCLEIQSLSGAQLPCRDATIPAWYFNGRQCDEEVHLQLVPGPDSEYEFEAPVGPEDFPEQIPQEPPTNSPAEESQLSQEEDNISPRDLPIIRSAVPAAPRPNVPVNQLPGEQLPNESLPSSPLPAEPFNPTEEPIQEVSPRLSNRLNLEQVAESGRVANLPPANTTPQHSPLTMLFSSQMSSAQLSSSRPTETKLNEPTQVESDKPSAAPLALNLRPVSKFKPQRDQANHEKNRAIEIAKRLSAPPTRVEAQTQPLDKTKGPLDGVVVIADTPNFGKPQPMPLAEAQLFGGAVPVISSGTSDPGSLRSLPRNALPSVATETLTDHVDVRQSVPALDEVENIDSSNEIVRIAQAPSGEPAPTPLLPQGLSQNRPNSSVPEKSQTASDEGVIKVAK